jgi:WD40 repeat protein
MPRFAGYPLALVDHYAEASFLLYVQAKFTTSPSFLAYHTRVNEIRPVAVSSDAMEAHRRAVIESLYRAALAKKPSERSSYLAAACADNPSLRSEIESLLAYAHVQLTTPAEPSEVAKNLQQITGISATNTSRSSPPVDTLPGRIGRYRILRLLGEGGMGVVYEAEQEQPRRTVALKVIKLGFASQRQLRRFEQESRALGRLQHPGIAQIYEAGSADSGFGPQPYFAMELIRGESLLQYAETHQLKTRQRLELIAKVCEAVQHAHQRGIIHRDLKPGNILVDESGQPKVLDFGVARATDSDAQVTLQTDVGQLVGTLAYMSPEQVLADPLEIDTRSDVYALGVILYELLAGRLPYAIGTQVHETVRTIREVDPVPLRSTSRSYRGDIETIVGKALEKDKARRYASAAGMAADIQRYLNNEPITARRPSAAYLLQKFARRNKLPVAAAAAFFVVLLAAFATTVNLYLKAKAAQASAEAGELLAWAAASLGEDPERGLILGLYSWGKQRAMVPGLEQFLHEALLRSQSRLTLRGHQDFVLSVAWSPDGSKLATTSWDRTAKVWDASTGRELRTLRGHQHYVYSAAWSPDSSKLATVSWDHTVKMWEVSTGRELLTLRGHRSRVYKVAWSPDGSKLATASWDHTAKVWEASTGREVLTLRGHQDALLAVAWSPDSKKLITASEDRTAKVWDASTGRELLTLRGHQGSVWSVAWSPDGGKLVTASVDRKAKVWASRTGRELLTLLGHQDSVLSVAWSPDGSKLATASWDHSAKLWEASTGRELLTLRGHQDSVWDVAWSPDGSRLATASLDHTTKVWEVSASRELLTLHGHQDSVSSVAWSPDGSKLATASWDHTAKLWEASTSRELLTLRGHRDRLSSITWSPDSSKLATTSSDHTAKVWEASTGRELLTLRGHQDAVWGVAWSPDGSKLATTSSDHTAKVWEASTGRELLSLHGHQDSVWGVAWSPDGSKLATASLDHTAKVWEVNTGRELMTLNGHRDSVYSVAWSPDGAKLATASWDHTTKVWEASTGRELRSLLGHRTRAYGVAWSPDGSKLATASWDHTAKVWDVSTGRELLTLRGHQDYALSVAWSPDGKHLASAGADGIAQIYAMEPVELLKLVRSRITRPLTRDECQRYMGTETCPGLPRLP